MCNSLFCKHKRRKPWGSYGDMFVKPHHLIHKKPLYGKQVVRTSTKHQATKPQLNTAQSKPKPKPKPPIKKPVQKETISTEDALAHIDKHIAAIEREQERLRRMREEELRPENNLTMAEELALRRKKNPVIEISDDEIDEDARLMNENNYRTQWIKSRLPPELARHVPETTSAQAVARYKRLDEVFIPTNIRNNDSTDYYHKIYFGSRTNMTKGKRYFYDNDFQRPGMLKRYREIKTPYTYEEGVDYSSHPDDRPYDINKVRNAYNIFSGLGNRDDPDSYNLVTLRYENDSKRKEIPDYIFMRKK